MILKESFSEEWIRGIQKKYRSDPILTEKVILALTLLEQLVTCGLDFVFKGGTSLILLLGTPRRLSIDIDIIVPPKEREFYNQKLDKIIDMGVFTRIEENIRPSKTEIPKEHYKFFYQSVINDKQQYILLDILFDTYPYRQIVDVDIQSPFLKTDNNNIKVRVPNINCILDDKLTAFAPNTTGIPYKAGKEMEIIKQLFDIAVLFDMADDIDEIKYSFQEVANKEICYRGLEITINDILFDVFKTSATIAFRGEKNMEQYVELITGAKKMGPYVLGQNFTVDTAIQCASKTAYLAMILLCDSHSFDKYSEEEVKNLKITNPEYNRLNKLRKADLVGYYYWCKALELHDKVFIDSVTLSRNIKISL